MAGYCTKMGPRGGAIPANMGIVKAQVLLWDHDPFYARPNQDVSYPLLNTLGESKTKEENFVFEANALSLKPKYTPQNMFVATMAPGILHPPIDANSIPLDYLDFVQTNSLAQTYLPPDGPNYDPDIFGHQLWIHCGSLFSNEVILRASEYSTKDIESTAYWQAHKDEPKADLMNAIQNAPRWDYAPDGRNNADGKAVKQTETQPGFSANSSEDAVATSFWPMMISKQSRLSKKPVHWTLEKFAPVWQGCDFFVMIRKDDKTLDYGFDKYGDPIKNSDGTQTWAPLTFDDFHYELMAYKKPTNSSNSEYVEGISNKAFYLDREEFKKNNNDADYYGQARKLYNFEFRPYILIEMGHGHTEHNYIIELAHGRYPRFLHIARYWDSAQSVDGTGEAPELGTYKDYDSCRVLSEFKSALSDQLLAQDELRVAVKNHLGKIIVSFSGHAGEPWVITKKNREEGKDPEDSSRFKTDTYDPRVFAVVPDSKIRIHGGNISCSLNFGFTEYPKAASLSFGGQSVDTHDLEDDDVYATASSLGSIDPANRDNGISSLFANSQETADRLGKLKMSYNCDAFAVEDYIHNRSKKIFIYRHQGDKIETHGKGLCHAAYHVPSSNGSMKLTKRSICVDGEGHMIRLFNGRGEGQPFKQSTGDDGDGEYVSTWLVGLRMSAGDIKMGSLFPDAEEYTFTNVLTPILDNWRLNITGDHKPTHNLKVIDISPLVTRMTDHWSVDDEGNTFNHEMSMTCYLPKGEPMGYDWRDDPEQVLALGCNTVRPSELYDLVNILYSLHDKAFYVTVKYWWGHVIKNGMPTGVGYQRDPDLTNTISGTDCSPRSDDTLIQMTGICYGGTLEVSNNKVFMHLQVKDYMDILKKQFIFNSPFFDGCSAHVAIYELAKLAGFDDCTTRDSRYSNFKKHRVDRRPLGLLQKIIEEQSHPDFINDDEEYTWNGERLRSCWFRLPITYASLANPAVRFPNGESYDNCMKFIAKQAGDIVYFDRYGVLRYETTAGLEVAFASDATVDQWYKPKIEFFTSPLVNIPASESDGGGGYDPSAHVFNPDEAANLIYNVFKYSRDVESCINQIVIATAIPDHIDKNGEEVSGFYYLGHCFYDQLFNPSKTGFLGFRKTLFVSNGVYGGIDETKRALQKYAAFSVPTSKIEFETFGVPCLKPHDVISVDGNLFYITEISHDISPEENKWWMNITAEWMRPFRGDLGLYKDEPSQ